MARATYYGNAGVVTSQRQVVLASAFDAHPDRFVRGTPRPQAVWRAQTYLRAGYSWVADLDVEKFLDRVNHDVLLSRVRARVPRSIARLAAGGTMLS